MSLVLFYVHYQPLQRQLLQIAAVQWVQLPARMSEIKNGGLDQYGNV